MSCSIGLSIRCPNGRAWSSRYGWTHGSTDCLLFLWPVLVVVPHCNLVPFAICIGTTIDSPQFLRINPNRGANVAWTNLLIAFAKCYLSYVKCSSNLWNSWDRTILRNISSWEICDSNILELCPIYFFFFF